MTDSRSLGVVLGCLLLWGCTETITDDASPGEGVPGASQSDAGSAAPAYPDAEAQVSADEASPPGRQAQVPGSACSCDTECVGDDDHPGLCVYGICMRAADATCDASGSREQCPAGSRCWALDQNGEHSICWPDCASSSCAGACDEEGSCVPTGEVHCNPACSTYCPEPAAPVDPSLCSESNTTGTCPEGASCIDGTCIRNGCPDFRCQGDCNELVAMPGSQDPNSQAAQTAGYYIATGRRYAFLRRDLTLLLQYAACEVTQRFPGTQPIGLSDMSQADGFTPGVDECGDGCARHPTSTHRGDDIDIAYFQTDGSNNPQIICGDGHDSNGNGRTGRSNDGYFCTTEENIIDWPRQLWWFAKLAESPLVRVFGIDSTLADDFQQGAQALREQGEISDTVYRRMLSLGWGGEGGWAFHHHHSHHSYGRGQQQRRFGPLPERDCRLDMVCPPVGGY